MITVILDRITIDPIDAQLPDACPKCGQDFSEPSALVEVGYMATRRTCSLEHESGQTFVGLRDTSEVDDELATTHGYRCGGCGEVLAMAAPQHVSAASAEGKPRD